MMRNVSRCVVLFTLWFSCSSARDAIQIENHNQSCVTHHLSIVPGSSVLLPCNFTYNPHNVVSWIHVPTVSVVTITSGGQVKFGDPRFGRIHTFPNQGSRGNFSISISRVNFTDLGSYQCLMQDQCVQVELALKTVKEKRTTEENGYENQVDDELLNRLRQASLRKHHYVNQEELRTQQKTSSFEHRNQKLIVYNHLLHRNVLLPACPRLLVRAVRAVNDSLWFWISPFPLPFESFSSERIVHLI
uniref:Ig-like domain-containing protein n=1 Tax=Knipowitschia caucasica TaxID=637954 RepID=A0AAV2IZX4_KNICA